MKGGQEAKLCSRCACLLLDANLFADRSALAAAAAELAAGRGDRELWLLPDAAGLAAETEDGPWQRVFAGGDAEASLKELSAAQENGLLADCLLITARERLAAWARQRGVAVLTPDPDTGLAEQLGLRSLTLRDTAALAMRAKRRREGMPCLLGINGIDKSGKTGFSERLAAQLEVLGFEVHVLALDIFTAPKKQRQAKDYPEPERIYHKTYDLDRLQQQLLLPLRSGRPASLQIDVYDRSRERVGEKLNLDLNERSLVILEGPFLFRDELFTWFDFRVYLVTDFERAMELDLGDLSGKQREKRQREFAERQLAAQSLYLRAATPWKRAHLVLRGVNGDSPRIESWRDQDATGDETVSATVY